uniref:Uncharacterized protein n=1 Tax=Noccaea caerulescens TaxID=107243 RepID=A0A1J3JBZ1_NOCCA
MSHSFIYALKYIECHVLGLGLSLVNDGNIKEARYKIACDLFEAAKDPVLIQMMADYVPPTFTPSPAVDIS